MAWWKRGNKSARRLPKKIEIPGQQKDPSEMTAQEFRDLFKDVDAPQQNTMAKWIKLVNTGDKSHISEDKPVYINRPDVADTMLLSDKEITDFLQVVPNANTYQAIIKKMSSLITRQGGLRQRYLDAADNLSAILFEGVPPVELRRVQREGKSQQRHLKDLIERNRGMFGTDQSREWFTQKCQDVARIHDVDPLDVADLAIEVAKMKQRETGQRTTPQIIGDGENHIQAIKKARESRRPPIEEFQKITALEDAGEDKLLAQAKAKEEAVKRKIESRGYRQRRRTRLLIASLGITEPKMLSDAQLNTYIAQGGKPIGETEEELTRQLAIACHGQEDQVKGKLVEAIRENHLLQRRGGSAYKELGDEIVANMRERGLLARDR